MKAACAHQAAGGAGIAGKLGYLAIAAPNAFWLLTTAFVLLLLSTLFKGL